MKKQDLNRNFRILSVDLGYSNIKTVRYDSNHVICYDKIISAVGKLPEKPLEQDDDQVFQLGPDFYVIGNAAMKVPKSYLLPLETFQDLKAIYPIVISYLLKKYSDEKFDKVIIGLSMAFKDKADELLKHLYDVLMISPETNFFVCLPQGISCKVGYAEQGLDLRESNEKVSNRLSQYVLIDLGMLTIDGCSIINGTSSAAAAIGVEGGVIKISIALRDYIFKTFNMMLSLKECQSIVDSPDGIFIKRGREYDVSRIVDDLAKKYILYVIGIIEDKLGESLDAGCQGIVLVGGGSYLFRRYIDSPDVLQEIEKHFPRSFLQIGGDYSEYYNAFSYLRIVEKMLENNK